MKKMSKKTLILSKNKIKNYIIEKNKAKKIKKSKKSIDLNFKIDRGI